MEECRNRIIAELAFSPEKAELVYNKIRYILIRPETLVRFQKMVEEVLGPMTSELMFNAAYDVGSQIGRKYAERVGGSHLQIITSMLDSASELGWARLYLRESEGFPNKVVLEAFNSAFGSAYVKSHTPVCHLLRGIFCGALSQIIGSAMESQEIECLATGFPKCVFEFKKKR